MRPLAAACAAVLLAGMVTGLTGCSPDKFLHSLDPQPAEASQPTPAPKPVVKHGKSSETKIEPSEQEIFDYIRGKLLSLSPGDGFNDNLEVSFDPASSVLSVTQPDGRCDIYLGAIDTNSALWETVDPSETYHTRPELLRLTLNSLPGKSARTCYDRKNEVDKTIADNRARLVFSHAKASAIPDFTEKMDKAIKKLVVLSGSAPAKELVLK